MCSDERVGGDELRGPVSIRRLMSLSTKACASIAARTCAPWMATPSWETLPALRARSAASSGSPGRDHGPAVDKDLGADLLGNDLAVQGGRAAAGRGDALLEAEERGVFGRVAHAAPPKDGAFLDDVVEPALPDLRGCDGAAVAVVGQGAQEGEGARDVVVGDDKGDVQIFVNVVVDFTEPLAENLVGPALEGAAEVDADQFAEDAGVDAFAVVEWDCHWLLPGRWRRPPFSGERRFETILKPATRGAVTLLAIRQPRLG